MAGARKCDDDWCDVSDAGHNDNRGERPGDACPDTDLNDTQGPQHSHNVLFFKEIPGRGF